MKRFLKLLMLYECFLLIMLTVSGCGFKDIDKRFFVVSIGIDSVENKKEKYLVSLKLSIPSQQLNAAENEFIIVSQKANSIAGAINKIKTKVDKELDFSHAKVIVFGEELFKTELPQHIMYWLIRRRDIQKIAYLGIAKPTALAVLKVKPKSERLPSNALFLSFGNSGTETPYIITELLFDFKRRLKERGLDPYMPIIEAKKDLFEINKVGVFNKKRQVLTLSPDETQLFHLLKMNVQKVDVNINHEDLKFLLSGENVRSKYVINTEKGHSPYINVQMKLSGVMEEALFEVVLEDIPQYEKAAEAYLQKQIVAFLKTLQASKVDPVGFGLRYRSRHFQNETEWETWQSIYPNIEFKVKVDVDIEGVGIIE